MIKTIHILYLTLLCTLLPNAVLAQYNHKDFNLKLTPDLTEKFDNAAKVIYDPANIALGDSIYRLGIAHNDTSELVGGLMLKSFPLTLVADFENTKKYTDIALEYTYNKEYSFSRFVFYQLHIRALIAQNDYQGSMQKAQRMSNDAMMLNHIIGINMSYYSMGLVLMLRNNPQLAITYFKQCEDMSNKRSLPDKLTWPIYIEMTRAYALMDDYKNADIYAIKAEQTARNCGDIYIANRARAIRYITRHRNTTDQLYVHEMSNVINDTTIMKALTHDERLIIMSQYLIRSGQKELALAIADSIESSSERMRNKESLYNHIGDITNAYKCRIRRDQISDSLITIIQTEDIAALDGEMNNKSLRILAEELDSRQKTTMQICAIIVILLLLASYIYINIHRRQTLKREKEMLKEEVNKQTIKLRELVKVINQKNSDITDSIRYAQRIQKAILPDFTQYIGHGINGAFTYFKPYNIVSGDFYWATKKNNKVMIACSDCTGHGVPGGFMSMIGSTLLSDITEAHPNLTASEILTELDIQVLSVLGQNNDDYLSDGMDMSFIIYNTETKQMTCSSARRPIYIIHNNELTEINGVKRSIGERDEICRQQPYTDHTISISEGDMLYLYTDGITDQFGGQQIHGENGKRLSKKGIKTILKDICTLNIEEQKKAFTQTFETWQGTCGQIDDMSLIGIKF